jgi:hypothetical protein
MHDAKSSTNTPATTAQCHQVLGTRSRRHDISGRIPCDPRFHTNHVGIAPKARIAAITTPSHTRLTPSRSHCHRSGHNALCCSSAPPRTHPNVTMTPVDSRRRTRTSIPWRPSPITIAHASPSAMRSAIGWRSGPATKIGMTSSALAKTTPAISRHPR